MVKLPLPLLLALLLVPLAAPSPAAAQGQFHKCVDAKGKVSYQDFPCGQAPAIGTPEAPRPNAASPAPADSASSPVMRQLDAAVKAAIAGRDLPRAKGLAVTEKHWEWIAEAEKTQQLQPVTGRTQADLRAEKGASQECRDARRNYELETRSPEAIEKMKHLMYEACGMDPPANAGGGSGQAVIVTRPRPAMHNPPPARSDGSAARQPRMQEPANTGGASAKRKDD
ncbi:MAG: DUF4124 domain-containing protein [Rhodocyclales bacterium]|nr:DUF4124 domain-containing protein [Rhodocyclales bacterium]